MADYRPQRPAYDREIELWTYQDAVEHLLDFFQVKRNSQHAFRMAGRAIDTAYRDIPWDAPWLYFKRTATFVTEASQSTGTIAYDFTGGTYERQVTLTGATWPASVRNYIITIDGVHYQIEDKKSTTIITLEQHNCPQADVAALTSYEVFLAAYSMPIDFQALTRLYDVSGNYDIIMGTAASNFRDSVYLYDSPGVPRRGTIRSTGDYFSSLEVILSAPPSTARTYTLMYDARPFPLLTEKHAPSGSTITTDGTTTAVGISSGFDSAKHTGSILRVSGNGQDLPSGKFGDRDDNINPFKYQRVIMSVTNATTVVLDTQIPTLSAVKFTVSSPIDIEQNSMFTMFLRRIESEFAMLMKMKDKLQYMAIAEKATRHAMENDSRTDMGAGRTRYYDRFSRTIITTDA